VASAGPDGIFDSQQTPSWDDVQEWTSSVHYFIAETADVERALAENFAKTKQFEAARAACDKAVHEAEHEKASLPSYQYWARSLENDYVAVALSNRAVLHWMTSDSEAAAADLKRAEELSPKSDFVLRNKSALEYSQTAVARVNVASK